MNPTSTSSDIPTEKETKAGKPLVPDEELQNTGSRMGKEEPYDKNGGLDVYNIRGAMCYLDVTPMGWNGKIGTRTKRGIQIEEINIVRTY